MYNIIFILCYVFILIATFCGIIKYTHLDTAMRFIVVLLALTSCSELCAYIAVLQKKYAVRYGIYHGYNIIQAVLFTYYYIAAIQFRRYKRGFISAALFWLAAGIMNIVFLQPFGKLNSNMLLLESFSFIAMSLYFIYIMLKRDVIQDIFRYAHFQMVVIFLVYWSCTLFFWGFVKMLYNSHWKHIQLFMYLQAIIEMLTYFAIAVVLYNSGKRKKIDT